MITRLLTADKEYKQKLQHKKHPEDSIEKGVLIII